MQIHELTLKKKTQVDEGLTDLAKSAASKVGAGVSKVAGMANAVGNKVADVKGAYQNAKIDQQGSAVADKAYRAWSTYRQQLDKSAPGGKADPATVEKQLLAFVSKNLLGGQYFANLINKDQILGVVKQIAGNDAAPPASTPPAAPPADATKPGADANAPQNAAATTTGKIEAGKEVALGNEHYRWLGAQWALVNPKTGQPGKTAEKGIAPELTKMAQAGKFVTPYTSPDAGALSPEQQAANKAIGNKAAPYGFDNATGKPLTAPPTSGPGVRAGNYGKSGQMSADVAASKTGQDLQKMFGAPKGGIQGMQSDLEENRYKDLDTKLREAVYKAKADNPNATDQNPYVQGRAGDGANSGQFAKFDPATSTTANASAGINAMAAGGQAARNAEKPAPTNPANELELFKKLVALAGQAQAEIATGQTTKTSAGDDAGQAGQNASSLIGQVRDTEQQQAQLTPQQLAKAGQVLMSTFQIDAGVGSTGDKAVDALLMAMGFRPA